MLPIFRSAITKIVPLLPLRAPTTLLHTLTKAATSTSPSFLAPRSVSVVPACTMKVMGKVRRRCKHCFLVMREGRLYNMCKVSPRHKQVLIQKPEHLTWTLTHATQGKFRPW